jgi:APA family basic amino acid/polyamine antiporter
VATVVAAAAAIALPTVILGVPLRPEPHLPGDGARRLPAASAGKISTRGTPARITAVTAVFVRSSPRCCRST